MGPLHAPDFRRPSSECEGKTKRRTFRMTNVGHVEDLIKSL